MVVLKVPSHHLQDVRRRHRPAAATRGQPAKPTAAACLHVAQRCDGGLRARSRRSRRRSPRRGRSPGPPPAPHGCSPSAASRTRRPAPGARDCRVRSHCRFKNGAPNLAGDRVYISVAERPCTCEGCTKMEVDRARARTMEAKQTSPARHSRQPHSPWWPTRQPMPSGDPWSSPNAAPCGATRGRRSAPFGGDSVRNCDSGACRRHLALVQLGANLLEVAPAACGT
jgi:hypothetical protein